MSSQPPLDPTSVPSTSTACAKSSPMIGGQPPTKWDSTASKTTMDTQRYTHTWKIEQFSTQQELSAVGDFVESVPFPAADNDRYRFRLRLFPNGKDDDCRGYLSLFLQIQRCPGARLRFRVNFYIETTEGQRGCALNRNIVSINRGGIVTASKFFSAESLKARASKFVPDDILTVGVDLTVFGEQSSKEMALADMSAVEDRTIESVFPTSTTANGSLLYDMTKMYERMTTPNMIIRIGDTQLQCHKAVVMARSSYFNAMFGNEGNSEFGKHEVQMHDISEVGMRAALQFMYTERVDAIDEVAQETLAVADMLNMDVLKAKAEEALIIMQETEDVADDACQLLVLADMYTASALKKHCIDVITEHRGRVMLGAEWIALQANHPALAAEILRGIVIKESPAVVPTSDQPKAKRAKLT